MRTFNRKLLKFVTFMVILASFLLVVMWYNGDGNIKIYGKYYKYHKPYRDVKQGFVKDRFSSIKTSRAVVIVSSFRTGSSFTGQLFNPNPNVFYLFEPLHPFTPGCDNETRKADLLTDLLKCNFTRTSKVYNNMSITNVSEKKAKEMKDCASKNFCVRHKSRALCSSEFCSNETDCKLCPPPNITTAQKVCTNASLRVTKVIRVCDFTVLKSLVTSVGLKIIYLVRDPRSTAFSRMELHSSLSIRDTCERYQINFKNFIQSNEAWVNESVMFVRYEDILLDPVTSLNKMYAFVGLEDDGKEDVLSWIRENTQDSDHQKFGTRRNSDEQMVKWRYDITMDEVNKVQQVCEKAMKIFGYNVALNEDHLRDTSDLLLSPFSI